MPQNVKSSCVVVFFYQNCEDYSSNLTKQDMRLDREGPHQWFTILLWNNNKQYDAHTHTTSAKHHHALENLDPQHYH